MELDKPADVKDNNQTTLAVNNSENGTIRNYLSLNNSANNQTTLNVSNLETTDRNSYLSLNADGSTVNLLQSDTIQTDEGNTIEYNKEGYDFIPDNEYDEMDHENEAQKSDEYTLLPEVVTMTTSAHDDKPNSSVHSQSTKINNNNSSSTPTDVISQKETESTEYMSVTEDMFLPPHKRT